MAESFETLVDLFETSTKKFSNGELFGTKLEGGAWRWTTYGEFRSMVERMRSGLHSLGVQKGDRVALISDNRVEWAVVAFAAYGLGAILVPMYESQLPKEWTFILDDCGAKVAFCAKNEIVDQLKAHAGKLDSLEHILGFELPADNASSYAHLMNVGEMNPVDSAPVTPSDVAGFIYTSGTTGNPKGVILSHGNFASNVTASGQRFDFGPADRTLAFLPWAHSFGQTAELYTMMSYGAAMAINDTVPNIVANLPVVRPTILVAVPRIFNRIYDGVNKQMAEKPGMIQSLFHNAIEAANQRSQGKSLGFGQKMALSLADKLIFSKIRAKFGGRLRFVVSGSAALSTEVAEFIDALGIEVFEGYGQTECSPVATANYPGNRKIGSVGKALPGVEVRIDCDVTDDPVNGEILISGPNVMRGYHNRPEETKEALMEDGTLRTGDMGYLDEEGYLYITGRIKEQYKLETGKFVVPSPLEEELKLSPYIINAMIYGLNKPFNVALVVPDTDALEKWAQDQGHQISDATTDPKVAELIRAELDKYGHSFKSYERPRKFAIVLEDFTTENDMLTPTLKLKRRNVLKAYQGKLEQLYS